MMEILNVESEPSIMVKLNLAEAAGISKLIEYTGYDDRKRDFGMTDRETKAMVSVGGRLADFVKTTLRRMNDGK